MSTLVEQIKQLAPGPQMTREMALNLLINVERGATIATIAGCCVWCDDGSSDGVRYPAPLPDITEEHPENCFSACCQEHADAYCVYYALLVRAVLRRNLEVQS